MLEEMYRELDGGEMGKASLQVGRTIGGLKEADVDGHAKDDGEAMTVMERVIEC